MSKGNERAMKNPPVDVLIIGAGASGAAMAWSLADTRMRILCLEQGDWVKPSDYPSNGRDWEARQLAEFNFSPNVRAAPADYPINETDSPIKIANYNGVGGGTVLYAGHFPRFHPSDFRVRSLDGVADDWPIDYATLAPFYAENDRMMGVSGLSGDPAYPPKEPMMPPLPLGKSGQTLARGMNKLGWHWWPSDSAVATEDYHGRARCINLGHCLGGCAQGAKASTDITYWPEAIRAGVELRTRCRVREITTNDQGMATGAIYYDADGVELVPGAPGWAGERLVTVVDRDDTRRLCIDDRPITPVGVQVRRVIDIAADAVYVAATIEPTEVHIARCGYDGTFTWLTDEPGVHGATFGGGAGGTVGVFSSSTVSSSMPASRIARPATSTARSPKRRTARPDATAAAAAASIAGMNSKPSSSGLFPRMVTR